MNQKLYTTLRVLLIAVAVVSAAVVVRDLPPHSVAVCAPTQVIQKAGLDNTFRVKIGGVDYVSRNGRLVREAQPE